MKISSKSILSPCRGRDAPISLSSSLSRRLRTNGSLRGGQSPMFPTGSKKRGCTLENPDEPSSPKVTCIGQVRVKTKKQGKRMRTLSKRRGGGEVSFRRVEQGRERVNPNQTQNQQECLPHRNQRWVHLPLTICEALSCLFPCRSSCFSTSSGREKEEKATAGSSEGNGQSSCGAVFARWSVALQDGERVKGREKIELVVGGEEEKTETRERILRRHVDMVEKIEIEDEKWEVRDCCVLEEEEEEEARVSICIPPKNALLLMRCRSDPMRMSALTNRLWESPVDDDLEEEGEDGEEGREDAEGGDTRLTEVEMSENLASTEDNEEEQENPEAEVHHVVMEVQEDEEKENPEEKLEIINEELQEEDKEKQEPVIQEVNLAAEAEKMENEEEETPKLIQEREEEEVEVETEALEEEAEKSTQEKETKERPLTLKEEEETVTQDRSESEERERGNHGKVERESEVKKKKTKKPERRSSSTVLPDCLLLMMREPKLSMEVSEETWVCTTDFIRWLPERPVNTKDGGGDPKKGISTDSNRPLPTQQNPAHDDQSPQQQQRPRSSCSFPAPAAMSLATMIEQKLANAVVHEPFVLTRCKSEPMRTAAAKLAPETCFWKNRKLEPHRRVGAAGVGF